MDWKSIKNFNELEIYSEVTNVAKNKDCNCNDYTCKDYMDVWFLNYVVGTHQ